MSQKGEGDLLAYCRFLMDNITIAYTSYQAMNLPDWTPGFSAQNTCAFHIIQGFF